jgi:hypothetical protein
MDQDEGVKMSFAKESFDILSKKVNHFAAQNFKLVRLNFPTDLEFEPIQLCNAKCFSCPYTTLSNEPEYTKQRMTRQQVESLLISFHENLMKYKYHGPTTINPYRFSDPLITPELDFILDFSNKHNLKVQITTNAKGLNSRTIPILERNVNALKKDIFISVLGSDEDEVKKNMNVSLEYTKKKMQELAREKSPILGKFMISLRVIDGSKEEWARLVELEKEFHSIGVRAQIKKDWMYNRIDGKQSEQRPDHFVVGCKLYRNKLLRRMEVMVNGDVVLCDDDAEGRRTFGNVFQQSIDEIWNGKLKAEHLQIFSSKFSGDKSKLLCVNCSRAAYNERAYSVIDTVKEIGLNNFRQQIKQQNHTSLG